ncbi:MAG: alpha/beta hydrolase family protein [Alistipes sp.]
MKRILFLLLFFCATIVRVEAASVDTLNVQSAAMQRDVQMVAVIPDVAMSETPCPVIYLLHGYGGNAYSWSQIKPNLPQIADRLGIIFICPSVGNSWYMNSPVRENSLYETFMTQELVPFVDAHFRTITDRGGRAITGLSMGGYGAMMLAMKHQNLFGAAGSMSGGLDIRPFPDNWELPQLLGEKRNNKARWASYTPINNISRIKDGELAIIIDCGYADFFLEVNKAFHQELLAQGIAHDFYVRPGEHNGSYWGNAVDYQILFFRKFFDRTPRK